MTPLFSGQALRRNMALGKLIHGDNPAVLRVKTSALVGEVLKHLEKISTLLSSSTPPDLILNRYCAECEFRDGCRHQAIEKDDLSLLAGIKVKDCARKE